MQDPDLQSATASEPLSVDEEYAMQRSWRTDRDKLTFIVCLPTSTTKGLPALGAGDLDADDRMIGDINLFLFEDNEASPTTDSPEISSNVIGEIELMIARKDLHRQGYGRAALLTFMHYVLLNWNQIAAEYSSKADDSASLPALAYLRVKIHQSNQRSIALFERVGFEMVGDAPNYFGEVELRWQGELTSLCGFPWYEQSEQLQYLVPRWTNQDTLQ
jgi:RimJ/RimL family protein N-acetyltransferase